MLLSWSTHSKEIASNISNRKGFMKIVLKTGVRTTMGRDVSYVSRTAPRVRALRGVSGCSKLDAIFMDEIGGAGGTTRPR